MPLWKTTPTFAQVVSVTPNTKTILTPRQQCHNVTVTRQAPVKDQHRVLGTALGATTGGAIGHQIGNGRGNTVATVVGAVGGVVAGHKVQENMQAYDTYTTTEQQRTTVYDKSKKQSAIKLPIRLMVNKAPRPCLIIREVKPTGSKWTTGN